MNAQQTYEREGHFSFKSILDKHILAELESALISSAAFDRKAYGGVYAGNLNTGIGEYGKLIANEILEAVKKDYGWDLTKTHRLASVGCNRNLPGAFKQRFHIDGLYNENKITIHFAITDVTLQNGSHDIIPFSHKGSPNYFHLVCNQIRGDLPGPTRLTPKKGDVVFRFSKLWHRGAENISKDDRFMGTIILESLEDENSDDVIAFPLGEIESNLYKSTFGGKAKEYFSVKAAFLLNCLRFLQGGLQYIKARLKK